MKEGIKVAIQRVPALHVFWDLEKTVLHETRVSGTVLWSPTNANSPTYTYIMAIGVVEFSREETIQGRKLQGVPHLHENH